MLRVCLVVFALLALVHEASANEAAVAKFRNLTPEQLRDLPKAVRSGEVPVMYTMAAQRGLAKDAALLFGMELNSLMYPGLHDYGAAVRAFQSDLGDEPTGILTVWQIHMLEQRAEMQKLGRVGFPEQFHSIALDGYARVVGTMTLLDETIAWPVNHTKISCSKATMTCDLEQIHLAFPDERSWTQMYQVIESPTESFEISRWQGSRVDAVRSEASASCRVLSLNLDFQTKEFFYIARNGLQDCEFMGTKMPRLAKPRIAQIVDGERVIASKFEEVRRAAFEVLSSDFRRRVREIQAIGETK
jgi:hypothetical protein